MDDTFSVSSSKEHSDAFLQELNKLHPTLQFTSESKDKGKLLFLDVMTIRNAPTNGDDTYTMLSTTVYRKPTFTGHYVRWDSFSSHERKLNLIRCLVN